MLVKGCNCRDMLERKAVDNEGKMLDNDSYRYDFGVRQVIVFGN